MEELYSLDRDTLLTLRYCWNHDLQALLQMQEPLMYSAVFVLF